MASLPRVPLVEVVHPSVLAFRSDEDGFVLRDDLDRLDRVRGVGAPEAVVLYCTRILEAMARVLVKPHHAPSRELAGNINHLRDYCSMPVLLKPWLDRLRLLGNDARHAGRPLSAAEGEAGFVILLRFLNWYCCEWPYGKFAPALLVKNYTLTDLLPSDFARALDRLSESEEAKQTFLASLHQGGKEGILLLTPILPAVLVEVLLGRGKMEDAYQLLTAARQQFNRDLRLQQLEGLYWSRLGSKQSNIGYLHRARKELEGLRPTHSAADEETLGILAGVYKRLADLDPGKTAWLPKCHETYRRGWDLSQQGNFYLGINAATTALWLDQKKEAQLLAEEVRKPLEDLREGLKSGPGGPRQLTYWDQVTLAEAYLLLENLDGARELYADAFTRFKENTGDHEVTRSQARRILEKLGRGDRVKDVLGG